jgi:hypothetical protein
LDVVQGALQDPLETDRRLGVALVTLGQNRRGLIQNGRQLKPQSADVGTQRIQHFFGRWVVQQRQQQMLNGQKLMAAGAGAVIRLRYGDLQFFRKHASAFCWFQR